MLTHTHRLLIYIITRGSKAVCEFFSLADYVSNSECVCMCVCVNGLTCVTTDRAAQLMTV